MTVPGSSPRMRGTLDNHHVNVEHGGIIPAYAGNTAPPSRNASRTRDHPRVCGEHTPLVSCPVTDQGSSPRMRGTHMSILATRYVVGIIPAYAGNTRVRPRSDRRPWDHPRVCGEHVILHQLLFAVRGSSPRMRGTHYQAVRAVGLGGIIPAYAGNTNVQT